MFVWDTGGLKIRFYHLISVLIPLIIQSVSNSKSSFYMYPKLMVKTLSATNPLTYTFVTSPKLLPIKETTSGEPESVLKRTPLS